MNDCSAIILFDNQPLKGGWRFPQYKGVISPKLMNIVKRYVFEFYGETMEVFLTDENKFILPVYELCGILGLSSNTQVRRIKRDSALANGLFYVRTLVFRSDNSSQTRSIACLWLNYVPYWLGYVNASLVKPELREKISRIKLDLAEITWSNYRSHILPPDFIEKIP